MGKVRGGRRRILSTPDAPIPPDTLETIARGFYREAHAYGFGIRDYLRFVNFVLDMSLAEDDASRAEPRSLRPALTSSSPTATATALPLDGPRLRIRAYDDATDGSHIRRWLADERGRYFMISSGNARTMDVEELIEAPHNVLGVIELPGGRAIGLVAYLDHDARQAKAELRKLIGEPDMRRRGYAKEATQAWIDYGIHALGLRKIYVSTLGTNIRNVRLNEELGFRVEGILRNEVLIDGRYHDILRMGLLSNLPAPEPDLATLPTPDEPSASSPTNDWRARDGHGE